MEERLTEKTIFHIDVNSAFLSWTAVRKLHDNPGGPDLRLIPSVIGGDEKKRHGIVTAKSLPAKKMGIHTAMTVAEALRICPNLLIEPPDFELYHEQSERLMELLRTFSPVQEQISIDECFLDMTQQAGRFLKPGESNRVWGVRAADAIRKAVREKLGFTVNVGVSSNKLLAKMASDFTKPDKTHTLFPEEVPEKMWPLPVGQLFGAGPSTAQQLRRLGAATIGQAAAMDVEVLKAALGVKAGVYIHESANGRGTDVVDTQDRDAVSMSAETTVASDLGSGDEKRAAEVIRELSERVSKRLRREAVYARTITVSVKTDDFRRHSRSISLKDPVSDTASIAQAAIAGYWQMCGGDDGYFHAGKKVRLVGVGATRLISGEFHQMNLADLTQQIERDDREQKKREAAEEQLRARKEKQDKLETMRRELDRKFGAGTVVRGIKL